MRRKDINEIRESKVGAKLKKNPDYYISGRPYLDGVSVPIFPMLQRGSPACGLEMGAGHLW
ncbi:MAG: hypothetical protein M1305_00510 [Candidatus Marsarchaeota archaeon]|nr:hypothetical protein [Candidatus Marsarchaeota archaeon]